MYNYTNRDWLSLEETLSLLEGLLKDPQSITSDPKLQAAPILHNGPLKNAAPADLAKPSYYPDPDPFTYAQAHGLNPVEFSAVKYITRWRKKDGLRDLEKAERCIKRLIADEKKRGAPGCLKA